MTSIPASNVETIEEMEEQTQPHWATQLSPRFLVKRPDVPGIRFNPEDSNVLRTDQDREAAKIALDSLQQQLRSRGDQPPEWFEALP